MSLHRKRSKHRFAGWQAAHEGEYISVLVNNAGIRKDALVMWMKNEEWMMCINTNLTQFSLCHPFPDQGYAVQKFGRIINVVSLSGIKGLARPGQLFGCQRQA